MPSLASTTWPAAASLTDRVLVVPVGATEQHGPHLPLTTDSDIAVALADRLLASLPHEVVVAPLVAFGSSGEHQAFAGTLSVGRPAIEAFLVELCRSATRTWRRVVLISTHGGNAAPVQRAAKRLVAEGREVRVWMPIWGGDAHAGRTETSLMLTIDPGRVDLAAAASGAREPIGALMPALTRSGVAAVTSNGVLGDPAGASAAEGEALLGAAVDALRELVVTW
jgi:mycofactocin system creatininase family protein